jgi:protease-4
MANGAKKKSAQKRDWLGAFLKISTVIGGLVSAFVMIFFVLLLFGVFPSPSSNGLGDGNVAVLPIEGVIMTSGSGGFSGGVVTSTKIVSLIQEFDEDEDIDALILEINSPGGSPVASDEIGQAIKKFSKPVVALIREVGASGGYWIASASDHIIANRMSVTGSIGVLGSGFGVEGLLDDYNVTYRRLVSGKYKDLGTPFKEMTSEEEKLLQQLLDSIHEEFIIEVSTNRNMSTEDVRELAHGFVFLGAEAKRNGLIDQLGGEDEAKAYMETELNQSVELAYYKRAPGLFDLFGGVISENFYSMGQGIGDSFKVEESLPALLR